MGILKIAADFMDSTMNNKRFNMGEVVGGDKVAIPHPNLSLACKTI